MSLFGFLMKWFVRLLVVLGLIIVAIAVIHFTLENTATVALTFYTWDVAAVPIATLILGMLAFGMLLSFVCLLPWLLLARIKLQRLQRQLSKQQHAAQSLASTHGATASSGLKP